MKWEYLGDQELHEGDGRGRGHTYRCGLWRTHVPGGWLLMTTNSRSNDPQPAVSYYPDPAHLWTGRETAQADILLRPASGVAPTASQELLRASDRPDPKLLEE